MITSATQASKTALKARLVRDANVPSWACRINDRPIAYYLEGLDPQDERRLPTMLCYYVFKHTGSFRHVRLPLEHMVGTSYILDIEGQPYQLSTLTFGLYSRTTGEPLSTVAERGSPSPHRAFFVTKETIAVLDGDVVPGLQAVHNQRWRIRKTSRYVQENMPEGYKWCGSMFDRAYKIQGDHVEVWKPSVGKILQPQSYKGRDFKLSYHPIHGDVIIANKRYDVDVATGTLTLSLKTVGLPLTSEAMESLRASAEPPNRCYDYTADEERLFLAQLQPGERVLPGALVAYHAALDVEEQKPTMLFKFRWGQSAKDFTSRRLRNGFITVLGTDYTVNKDLSLSPKAPRTRA